MAFTTISKAFATQKVIKEGLILHSDRGSQYTSKEFSKYCEKNNISQSMSKPGCPYDNAPMERYFNSLKCEQIYNYSYSNDEELNQSIEEYAYVFYNHQRPHTYNQGLTPFEARCQYQNQKCYKKA